MNNSYCLTVEDVYGEENPTLPDGWKLTGEFRPPKVGEMFLPVVTSDGPLECNAADYPYTGPRLIIMRKKTTPTVESEYMGQSMEQLRGKMRNSWWGEGYEWTGEFRPVREGDYFLCASGGNYVLGPDKGAWTGLYRVIMKKLPTIEDIYGAPLEKLKAPEGLKFTGEFRKPSGQDICLHPSGKATLYYPWEIECLKPRLILEKLPATPTIKNVYGMDNPPLPKGWKMKEFRQVTAGENVEYLGLKEGVIWLASPMHARNEICRVSSFQNGYRIVLERDLSQMSCDVTFRVEDIYLKIPTIPAGYRVVDFRVPKPNELALSVTTGLVETNWVDWNRPRLIVEREN